MTDTTLGALGGRTYVLREPGGARDGEVEAGETIQLVVQEPGHRDRVLDINTPEAQAVLRNLGIGRGALPVGTHVNPMAGYISSLQAAERATSVTDMDRAVRGAIDHARAAGIQPDWSRIATIVLTRQPLDLRSLSEEDLTRLRGLIAFVSAQPLELSSPMEGVTFSMRLNDAASRVNTELIRRLEHIGDESRGAAEEAMRAYRRTE